MLGSSGGRAFALGSLSAALIAAGTVVVTYGPWPPGAAGSRTSMVTGDNLSILAEVWALGCCLYAVRRTQGRMRLSWMMLASMILLFAGGDVLWLVYGGASGHPSILSLADLLYLVGLGPAVIGLLLYPVARGLRASPWPVLLDAAVLGSSALLVSQVLVFAEVAAKGGSARDVTMYLIYPTTDVLLACLVLVLLVRSVGEARIDVVLLGLMFALYAVADNAYALLSVRGEDYSGTFVDVVYVVAPLLLGLAALSVDTFPTSLRMLRRQLAGIWAPVLPDLAAVAALAVGLVWLLRGTGSWALAAAVLLLTGLRQISLTAQAQRMRLDLERRVVQRTDEVAVITERHRRLEAMKYTFVSSVSHELRTPLTAIRGCLEMLADGDAGELPSTARDVVAVAARGSERLSRLVDNIIDLERLESGVFTFRPALHHMNALLDEAAASLRFLSDDASITVIRCPAGDRAMVDADQILQALINLLGNAVKFTPPGGRITLQALSRGEQMEVSVSDHGRGIPQDQLAAVFDRFHQVDTSDAQVLGGAGLGLTITRHIVEAHGGRIWVESEVGQGCTFRFTIPLRHAPVVIASPAPPASLRVAARP